MKNNVEGLDEKIMYYISQPIIIILISICVFCVGTIIWMGNVFFENIVYIKDVNEYMISDDKYNLIIDEMSLDRDTPPFSRVYLKLSGRILGMNEDDLESRLRIALVDDSNDRIFVIPTLMYNVDTKSCDLGNFSINVCSSKLLTFEENYGIYVLISDEDNERLVDLHISMWEGLERRYETQTE